jgi:threonine efflux protein
MGKKLFEQGFSSNLVDPKYIFTWVAIVSLALPQNRSSKMSSIVVVGCSGVLIFGGYAFLFSTKKGKIYICKI